MSLESSPRPPAPPCGSSAVTRTGEYMLTPFWVSVFLGLFPLRLQITRNSETFEQRSAIRGSYSLWIVWAAMATGSTATWDGWEARPPVPCCCYCFLNFSRNLETSPRPPAPPLGAPRGDADWRYFQGISSVLLQFELHCAMEWPTYELEGLRPRRHLPDDAAFTAAEENPVLVNRWEICCR